jgi:hypothetical protein
MPKFLLTLMYCFFIPLLCLLFPYTKPITRQSNRRHEQHLANIMTLSRLGLVSKFFLGMLFTPVTLYLTEMTLYLND